MRRHLLRAVLACIAPSALFAQEAPVRLSLHDAIVMARSKNFGAALAEIRAEEIGARVGQRRADLLPSVSAYAADGQRSYNTASFGLPFPGFDPNGSIIGPVRTVDLRARVGMSLYDASARARYSNSKVVADSAEAGHAVAMDAAAFTAATAYLRALRANATLAARGTDSSSAAELVQIAHDVLEAGVGVALDVTRAESQLAGVRTQLAGARNEQSQAMLALRRALGMALTQPLVLTDSLSLTNPEAPAVADAIAVATRERPELRAESAGVEAARLSRKAAAAARIPSVGAFLDNGYTSAGYSHLMRTYAFGIQLNVPIFEGGRTEGRVDEQDAVLRAAELRLADATDQVSLEVRSALLDFGAAREQVDLAAERLRLAEAEVSQAQERFRAGVAGNADVITALLTRTASRAQLIDAETSLRYSQISLARAEGLISGIQ